MSYIHYDTKPNGAVYASVYESYREGNRVKTRRLETLGRVVDKDAGIFRGRGNKLFQYTIENGRNDSPDYFPEEQIVPDQEKLILDFGDTWFLKEYISGLPFYNCIVNALPGESDTLLALLFFRMLTNRKASCHAKPWYEGNYAYLAFGRADLTSQNISKVLSKLGQEETQRSFLREYLSSIYSDTEEQHGILIDSTGVPNATKMDITQISNHNGDINRKVRVVYVIDRKSGMPVYFRYIAGNIIDVSTLITTVSELQQYGVSVNQAILDAGYFSEKNAQELLDNDIPFLTRLAPNKPIFKAASEGMFEGLMSQKYAYRYGERLVFIRKVPEKIGNHQVYVYICIDEDMYLMQHKKTILNALDDKKAANETDSAVKQLGAFALLSSEDLSENDILPLYYTRQQVEQVFDISKNYADLLPIRVQSEERFAGHLLLCFMATAIFQRIQKDLLKRRSKKAKSLNAESIWDYLRNQKCKVYDSFAVPQEPRKEVNAIYDIFKIQMPHKIPLSTIQV